MRSLSAVLLLIPILSFAQGVSFENGSWKSALAKAQKENRLIYVDVYTTWCGPCKVLEKTIFPQKEAGDKYNANFVNYHIDAEKGEGIAFAKKYAVTGSPTNLFIDPKTEGVIYRVMGMAGGVKRFNEHADIALAERQDPMTWERYTQSFKSGKRDAQFLTAYLRKAERLDKPNDEILNAYLATLDTKNLPDSVFYFLADQTKTIWNNAVPVLYEQRERLAKRDTGEHYYGYEHLAEGWLYPSFEVALAEKSDQRLGELEAFISSNIPAEDITGQTFFYRKRFYEATKNAAALKAAETEEANTYASMSLADFAAGDEKARKNQEASIRFQLTAMTLPENANIDTIVAENLARRVKNLPSMRAATTLNSLAWKTYENKKATAADLEDALKWSAKAMEFSAPYPEAWARNADTYASLLYRTGKKSEAVSLEEKALQASEKAGNKEDAAGYKETLQRMQAGTY